MDCRGIDILIIDYINNELCEEMNDSVREHLEQCRKCKDIYEETKDLLVNMENISQAITTDTTDKDRLKENLLQELRIHRATSPFLSALFRRKKEIKRSVTAGERQNKKQVR